MGYTDRRRLLSAALGSPITLFRNGEAGVWHDPSDLTTMYQDSAGTTPVLAAGDPVGLILDKAKGVSARDSYGPELVTNGGFDTDVDGWGVGSSATLAWSAGTAIITNPPADGYGYMEQMVATTAGASYAFEVDVIATGGNGVSLKAGTTAGGTDVLNRTPSTTTGRRVVHFVATSTETYILVANHNNGASSTIDNISIREITRTLNGLGDELVTNGDFSDGSTGWSVAGEDGTHIVTFDGDTCRYQSDTTTPALSVTQVGILTAGKTYHVTYDIAAYTSGQLKTDVVGGQVEWATSVGTHSFIFTSLGASFAFTRATSNVDITIDNVSVREIPGSHLIQDANDDYRPTLQQSGNLWYLDPDGVDDYMYIPSLDMSASDKVTVWAGVHKSSDVSSATVCELSSNLGTNNGSFLVAAPGNAGLDRYQWGSKGTTQAVINATGFVAPTTNVLTGIGDISGDEATLRVDGAQAATSSGDQGTGNFGTYPLYVGARAGSSLFFEGRIYGLVIRGGASTDAEITKTERYMARKTGVTL